MIVKGNGVHFEVLEGSYAIAKLPFGYEVERPSAPNGLWSLTHTEQEISLVCREEFVPKVAGVQIEGQWRAIRVKGPLDFELKGVLASLLNPLAAADVCVFVLSTYDTDYVLVKEFALLLSVAALRAARHSESVP